MGLSFLIFFAVGYWTAGVVICADRMISQRIKPSFNRRMMRIALLDLVVALVVLIVKYGGR